ncbi:MAG: universal stress protein [Desulfobacterales bacterium]|nr:universal stress protein [Desulfobacterales bacterium]
MFNHIIIALKFTDTSKYALQKGIELARENNAKVTIFHALDHRLAELDHDDPKRQAVEAAARTQFETEITPQLGDASNFTFLCLPLDPALGVCRQAKEQSADLIVLGCHQQPEKMSLGRVDYVGITILEKAPCPVLLVPHA